MNHSRISFILLLISALIFTAHAQAQTPTLPDLTGQQAIPWTLTTTLNGEKVTLTVHEYFYVDWDKLERHFVQLINNKKNKPWLAFYQREVGEKLPNDDTATKETHYYLFQNIKHTWVLVKDLSLSKDVRQELFALLKNRYKLELGV